MTGRLPPRIMLWVDGRTATAASRVAVGRAGVGAAQSGGGVARLAARRLRRHALRSRPERTDPRLRADQDDGRPSGIADAGGVRTWRRDVRDDRGSVRPQ